MRLFHTQAYEKTEGVRRRREVINWIQQQCKTPCDSSHDNLHYGLHRLLSICKTCRCRSSILPFCSAALQTWLWVRRSEQQFRLPASSTRQLYMCMSASAYINACGTPAYLALNHLSSPTTASLSWTIEEKRQRHLHRAYMCAVVDFGLG